jgi:hypothetical protein
MNDHVFTDPDLIDALTADGDPYLSCADCFEQTDVAVETLLGSHGHLSAAFRVHLLQCAACHDEALSLAGLIAADFGLTPVEATARLEADLARAA